MALTNATKRRLLDALYGNIPVAPASTLYVALSSTTPTKSGSNFSRPSGGAYADVAVPNDATNWPAASDADPSEKANGQEITFPQPTGSWGTLTHWGISESQGGPIIDWAPLAPVRTINADSAPPAFAPGALRTRIYERAVTV